MALSQAVRQRIDSLVSQDKVVVFMKGRRNAPECGFSTVVAEILDGYLEEYTAVDILGDAELRDGLREYSQWPTIPQVYVDGEFVGGVDVLRQLHEAGQLAEVFGDRTAALPPADLQVTQAAATAIRDALSQPEGEVFLRLRVNSQFYNDLSVDPPQPGDITMVSCTITVVVDPATLRRAHGSVIDYVTQDDETGFRVDNPNVPAAVAQLIVSKFEQMIRDPAPGQRIIDVRTPQERRICAIESSELYDLDLRDELLALPRETPLVFCCHHGGRSQRLAEDFVAAGFRHVYNVVGGIDAWAREIDPKMARY